MANLLLYPVARPDINKFDEAYEVAGDLAITHYGELITVPKFFQYDGASIPPAAWQLVGTPFQPRFMLAAVFHDWLYHTHQLQKQAPTDELFYELLLQTGVNKNKAAAMLAGVRLAGGWYWDNDEEDEAYLVRLAERILADGRDPADYGMS
jgi:hypothetical protein